MINLRFIHGKHVTSFEGEMNEEGITQITELNGTFICMVDLIDRDKQKLIENINIKTLQHPDDEGYNIYTLINFDEAETKKLYEFLKKHFEKKND